MENTEETAKQQNEFDYMVRDAFSRIDVHLKFKTLLFFYGEDRITMLPRVEINGSYNILGSAAKFDGTYYLEDGVWQRNSITALFDAKPTVASWTHKIDGTHTHDTSILKHVENAISTYWNKEVCKASELAAIHQCSLIVENDIAETEEALYRLQLKQNTLAKELEIRQD